MLQAAQDDLGQLRTQLWEAQAEVENIKAIATVSENTKQEAIDEVKRQWREEVASLQAVMKGKTENAPLCRGLLGPPPPAGPARSEGDPRARSVPVALCVTASGALSSVRGEARGAVGGRRLPAPVCWPRLAGACAGLWRRAGLRPPGFAAAGGPGSAPLGALGTAGTSHAGPSRCPHFVTARPLPRGQRGTLSGQVRLAVWLLTAVSAGRAGCRPLAPQRRRSRGWPAFPTRRQRAEPEEAAPEALGSRDPFPSSCGCAIAAPLPAPWPACPSAAVDDWKPAGAHGRGSPARGPVLPSERSPGGGTPGPLRPRDGACPAAPGLRPSACGFHRRLRVAAGWLLLLRRLREAHPSRPCAVCSPVTAKAAGRCSCSAGPLPSDTEPGLCREPVGGRARLARRGLRLSEETATSRGPRSLRLSSEAEGRGPFRARLPFPTRAGRGRGDAAVWRTGSGGGAGCAARPGRGDEGSGPRRNCAARTGKRAPLQLPLRVRAA